MFYKVNDVKLLPNLELLINFTNGIVKKYDVKPLLDKWEVFQVLTIKELFECVRVDYGGYGIVWNDEIDLSCNELWNNGKVVNL